MTSALRPAILLACLSACLTQPLGSASAQVPDEPAATEDAAAAAAEARDAVYAEFRRQFEAGQFAVAVPLAREVLRLTIIADDQHDELPTALNNLGVVQLRAGDLAGAEESFGKALELLETTEGIGSRRLIAPLAGLGATYAAAGQPARAAEAYERAIAVSRRAAGLFNLEQLEFSDALVNAYAAVGFTEGIDRERRYALQVVEQRYGFGDPRTLPRMTQLAEWYEASGRYAPARALYKRVVAAALTEGDGRNTATINALLGIARSHRLQFAEDPESMVEASDPLAMYIDPLTGRPVSRQAAAGPLLTQPPTGRVRLDPEGRKALQQAQDILESATDPPAELLSRTLLELGDWHVTAGTPQQAIAFYERAWPLLESLTASGAANPLVAPRRLVYRSPAAHRRSRDLAGDDVVERRAEFRIDIDALGQPGEVTLVTADMNDYQTGSIRRALQRAAFSPAFVDGQPVVTSGLRFDESWFERSADAPPAAPQGAGGEDSPADAGDSAASEDSAASTRYLQ
jgi:tetratricopeptide (TPR) repeat protein